MFSPSDQEQEQEKDVLSYHHCAKSSSQDNEARKRAAVRVNESNTDEELSPCLTSAALAPSVVRVADRWLLEPRALDSQWLPLTGFSNRPTYSFIPRFDFVPRH